MDYGKSVLKVKQRDIILIKFPFSDYEGYKVRPAIVISNNNYNISYDDVIVCAITTNILPSDFKVILENPDIESGSLPRESAIRIDKPYSISKSKF
jgi:mRNA interferase MazF